MIASLDENGTMAVVLPHGVLFRGAGEGTIRKHLIEKQNCLDAVIGLPANIFFGTSIPTVILVFKKNRVNKDNILFIDASNDFEKGKNQNVLRDIDVNKIVDTYKEEKKVEQLKQQPKEEKKVDKQKQQPKEEKKAENTRVKEIFGRESMYNALGGKNVMTYEDYLEKLNTLDGFAHEDEMKYLCDVLNDLNDEEYKEIKSDVDNAKTEEDFMAIVAKIEMMRLTSKLGTKEQPNYEGFKSLIVDDFKVKNLTEDEMKTIYDVFIKALEDGEINDALDKALEQVNIKENRKEQKINRENDRPKNIHEEEWKRYFQLNLKNKKRGTMKGYLYKKAKLYRDSFGGNETPNNLVMRLNDIDRLLGSCLIYDTTLTNNDSIMKAVAKYLETVLDKDNFSNSIMRDLIDRCLPQFEDIVING